jgi:hypothetical protein
MKVISTRTGFYGLKRRKEGEVFELAHVKGVKKDIYGKEEPIELTPEQQFSSSWMKKLVKKNREEFVAEDDAPVFSSKKKSSKEMEVI